MNVELPDAPVAAARLTPEEVRLRLAFSLYGDGSLSTGLCAELAGMDRRAFMDQLAKHKVEAPFTVADLEADLADLRALGRL
jgi:predicted HTH domain antitoxin